MKEILKLTQDLKERRDIVGRRLEALDTEKAQLAAEYEGLTMVIKHYEGLDYDPIDSERRVMSHFVSGISREPDAIKRGSGVRSDVVCKAIVDVLGKDGVPSRANSIMRRVSKIVGAEVPTISVYKYLGKMIKDNIVCKTKEGYCIVKHD